MALIWAFTQVQPHDAYSLLIEEVRKLCEMEMAFLCLIFIPFSHFMYQNAHNCEITSLAGTARLARL